MRHNHGDDYGGAANLKHRIVLAALLSDRDSRRDSLQGISVVALRLAGIAFVAFAQAPGRAQGFQPGRAGNGNGTPKSAANADPLAPKSGHGWLRAFF